VGTRSWIVVLNFESDAKTTTQNRRGAEFVISNTTAQHGWFAANVGTQFEFPKRCDQGTRFVAKKISIAVDPASMSFCVSRFRVKGPNPEERLRL
jgi:hypothetical protein